MNLSIYNRNSILAMYLHKHSIMQNDIALVIINIKVDIIPKPKGSIVKSNAHHISNPYSKQKTSFTFLFLHFRMTAQYETKIPANTNPANITL